MFDLIEDPTEQKNLLFEPASAKQLETAAKFEELKAEIARLKKEYRDDDQYADPSTWPKTSVDGPFNTKKPIGMKSVSEAIALSEIDNQAP